jgi:type VI secretion system protein ImpG
MDERLVEHYNTELRHLRETAGEFAREFPKIAGRLSLDKDGKEICPDPYVERLLEGFAFLAARIHLKLDAEFPRFTQSLLETVYPDYLSPIPSMAVVRFEPEENDPALAAGIPIAAGTLLRSNLGKGERTPCTFRTAHTVQLLPLRIVEAHYLTRDIARLNLPPEARVRAAIQIKLQLTAAVPLPELQADSLTFYVRGTDDFPSRVIEHIFSQNRGVAVQCPAEKGRTLGVLPKSCIRRVGMENEEALLPPSPRTFEGYRLLREYFAFPQRFLFFEIKGVRDLLARASGAAFDLVILLEEGESDGKMEARLDASAFELFCTPAINLFPRALDRIPLSDRFSEFHVVPDVNRPLDYEVYRIESVTGHGTTAEDEREFRPFYLAKDADVQTSAFYTSNRIPRMLTEKERQVGRRSAYTGTEVYLSLVDASCAPYHPEQTQLGISALCTNRHLPIQMATGVGRDDFTMEASAPVASIRCLSGPTIPQPSLAEGRFSWRLISHLSLNYFSLLNSEKGEGAGAVREMLKLYCDAEDRQAQRQIKGLASVDTRPVVRRVPSAGPTAFARGLEIILEFDEKEFEGTGVFALGSVLERFFAKYVSINSFTETVIRSQQRGELIRWPAQMGKQPIV